MPRRHNFSVAFDICNHCGLDRRAIENNDDRNCYGRRKWAKHYPRRLPRFSGLLADRVIIDDLYAHAPYTDAELESARNFWLGTIKFREVNPAGLQPLAADFKATEEIVAKNVEHFEVAVPQRLDKFQEKATGRHKSDCAIHNGPAYPPGPCTCGAEKCLDQ